MFKRYIHLLIVSVVLLMFFGGDAFTLLAQEQVETTTGRVSGAIVAGTANMEIASGLPIVLHIVDSDRNETTFDTITGDGGRFVFEDVVLDADYVYFATVFYGQGYFISEFKSVNVGSSELELSITVFELTSDPTVIQVTEILTQISRDGSSLVVVQIVHYENTSDRLYLTDEIVNDYSQVSVVLPLPEGATSVQFTGDSDFLLLSNDGRTVADTQPVFPGDDHIVHVIYSLPFSHGFDVVQRFPYVVNGAVSISAQDDLSLSADWLIDQGIDTSGDVSFRIYEGNISLAANETLRYRTFSEGGTDSTLVLILGVMVVIVLVGAGVALWLRRRVARSSQSTLADALVTEMAELDRAYQAGELDAKSYQRLRERVKSRLAKVMS